ncbi:MAG: hypothetical protein JSU94_06090 [Phycisphaerales bacterium]|nr:MAG: hypothetical protein JSU94_06090 [Phycisphaerales bacterium]
MTIRQFRIAVAGAVMVVFAPVSAVHLESLSEKCDRFEKQTDSIEQMQQAARELEADLAQYPDIPDKARAYLLVVKLSSGSYEPAKLEKLLNAALRIPQIRTYDEIAARYLLGNVLFAKPDHEGAFEQWDVLKERANELLRNKAELDTVKPPAYRKPPPQSIANIYRVTVEKRSEILFGEGRVKDASVLLADYAKDILAVAPLYDRDTQDLMIDCAARAWTIAGIELYKSGLRESSSELFAGSLAALKEGKLQNDLISHASFQMEFGQSLAEHAEHEKALQNVVRLFEASTNKPWLVDASLPVIQQMDLLQRYGFLLKLISVCAENTDYLNLHLLYLEAGVCAHELGINDQAVLHFEDFLRLFPDHTLRRVVEGYLGPLRENKDVLLEEALRLRRQRTQPFTRRVNYRQKQADTGITPDAESTRASDDPATEQAAHTGDDGSPSSKHKLLVWCFGFILLSVLLVCLALWRRRTWACN